MIATITLNPSIDQSIVVPHLFKDDTNRAVSVLNHAGGKGVNVSKVIRELGGPTRAYTLQAGFIGKLWASELSKLDIAFTSHQVPGEMRINTILTDTEDGTQTRISALGPNVSEFEQRLFLRELLNTRPKPFCWVIGGSPSGGMKPDIYKKYILALQRTGTPCVLDADDEALKLGIQAVPFMIKPNEYEIQRLVGKKLSSLESYHQAAFSLTQKGIKIVVVSLAARGALFVTAREALYAEGVKVPVKSKVGAGDSLVGGLLLGLMRKMSLEKSASLGIAASASAVMREAPRHCRRSDIPSLLRRVKVHRLS